MSDFFSLLLQEEEGIDPLASDQESLGEDCQDTIYLTQGSELVIVIEDSEDLQCDTHVLLNDETCPKYFCAPYLAQPLFWCLRDDLDVDHPDLVCVVVQDEVD